VFRAIYFRTASELITSPKLRRVRRSFWSGWRGLSSRDPVVRYFHDDDDPYSQLTAGVLPALQRRYRIRLDAYSVPPPQLSAAPDIERLQHWSRYDAVRLAMKYGLAPARLPAGAPDGSRLRQRLGHYLGATFHFEGEWYWGIDRLHYLERRLIDSGLATSESTPMFPPPELQWRAPSAGHSRPTLHFFCSLRSPYTWLAAERVRRLAEHYGAELRLRFVLPMVMRGLPVPFAKRLYILRDTKREAERLALPFGCIVDPVGSATERGLAVLHRAIDIGRGPDFLASFLRGVFAEGIDATTTPGLLTIAARAGLSAGDVKAGLARDDWREVAEANRAELLACGLWGVPSFRVDDRPAVWGQDRLWMIEQDLIDTVC